jgi:hypothetical protein
MRDRRKPKDAQPAESPRCLTDHGIACEEAKELCVIVVDSEDEAQSLEPFLARGAQHDAAVDQLVRARELDTIVDADRGRQRPVADVSCRVRCVTDAERERVGTRRPEDPFDR